MPLELVERFSSHCLAIKSYRLHSLSSLRYSRVRCTDKARTWKKKKKREGKGLFFLFLFSCSAIFLRTFLFRVSPLFRIFSTIWEPGTGYTLRDRLITMQHISLRSSAMRRKQNFLPRFSRLIFFLYWAFRRLHFGWKSSWKSFYDFRIRWKES